MGSILPCLSVCREGPEGEGGGGGRGPALAGPGIPHHLRHRNPAHAPPSNHVETRNDDRVEKVSYELWIASRIDLKSGVGKKFELLFDIKS
jgi:hypothetical protein